MKVGAQSPIGGMEKPRGSPQGRHLNPHPALKPISKSSPSILRSQTDSTGPPPDTPVSLGGLPGQSPGCLPSLQPGLAAKRKIPARDSAFWRLGLTQWGTPLSVPTHSHPLPKSPGPHLVLLAEGPAFGTAAGRASKLGPPI